MNVFAALEETDRYKELEAIPLATNMRERSMEDGRIETVTVEAGDYFVGVGCWVFEDGTRSKFTGHTLRRKDSE